MTARVLDREVTELLRDEPELLAVADAIAATQFRPSRRPGLLSRLATAGVLAAVAATALLALPGGEGRTAPLERALSALGREPVLHVVIEAAIPTTTVVDLATGRHRRPTVEVEYWFDRRERKLRTVVRHGGAVTDDLLQTAARGGAGAPSSLDPALAGFVTGYRKALARGEARVAGEGTARGRDAIWLELGSGTVRERVAVDEATYRPLAIEPLRPDGRPGLRWLVTRIETVRRGRAPLDAPAPQRPRPYRGDVAAARAVSAAAAAAVPWATVWLGERWRGLRLVTLERHVLTRGYPPDSSVDAERGEGIRLRYVGGRSSFVDLSQAPRAEPAYAFQGGRTTFRANPLPAEGSAELVAVRGETRTTWLAQLRVDGTYVTIWAATRELALAAARELKPIRTGASS